MEYCPKFGKKVYATKRLAELTLEALELPSVSNRQEHNKTHKWIYYCPHCKGYHLTSKVPKPKKKKK